MELTMWLDTRSGRRLGRSELCSLRHRARALYAANTHIFEDEAEALVALGAVSMLELVSA
jgi:hypothetical protein